MVSQPGWGLFCNWIFSRPHRSQLLPWAHGTRWPGNGLWQHLGVWPQYRDDSASVWNFATPDGIRVWGQRPWCHGNPAEMVIKRKQWSRLDTYKQEICIRAPLETTIKYTSATYHPQAAWVMISYSRAERMPSGHEMNGMSLYYCCPAVYL